MAVGGERDGGVCGGRRQRRRPASVRIERSTQKPFPTQHCTANNETVGGYRVGISPGSRRNRAQDATPRNACAGERQGARRSQPEAPGSASTIPALPENIFGLQGSVQPRQHGAIGPRAHYTRTQHPYARSFFVRLCTVPGPHAAAKNAARHANNCTSAWGKLDLSRGTTRTGGGRRAGGRQAVSAGRRPGCVLAAAGWWVGG